MKYFISTLFIIACISSRVSAQSTWWKEWFDQKSTQREYLLNQIAALRVYSGYLKQGYSIYKAGHNTIGNFKRGEFNLHNDFFLSLKGINPEVARYARVADIITMQLRTVRICNAAIRSARESGLMQAGEVQYISRVYGRLLQDCAALVDELTDLTTSGKLEMEDDQRLQRIDLLHSEMQDKYLFAETFSNETKMLREARKEEQSGVRTLQRLSGQ